jgi:peptide methionine sulfoxide reductase MsrA
MDNDVDSCVCAQTIAEDFIKELQPKYKDKIVVEVKEAGQFWPAEDYHQKYLEKVRNIRVLMQLS